MQIEPTIVEDTETMIGGHTNAMLLRLGEGTLEPSDGDPATFGPSNKARYRGRTRQRKAALGNHRLFPTHVDDHAHESFTLARLAQVSQFLGFTLAELLQTAATSVPPLDTLTTDQEAQLVSDDKLILVAVCALNHWSLADILSFYDITRMEAIKRLRILDRMGMIELLPGDRIRRRAKRDFDWIQDGPIRRYFAEEGLTDFIAGPFDANEESLDFAHGMLTPGAQAELKVEFRRLRAKLSSLHEQSIPADITEKRGVGVLLALRRWEPITFARLRRDATESAHRSMV